MFSINRLCLLSRSEHTCSLLFVSLVFYQMLLGVLLSLLYAQAKIKKKKVLMNRNLMAYQRMLGEQNTVIEQLQRSQEEDQSLIKTLQLENEKLRTENKLNKVKNRKQLFSPQQEKQIQVTQYKNPTYQIDISPKQINEDIRYCWETQETQRAFVPPVLFSYEKKEKFEFKEAPISQTMILSMRGKETPFSPRKDIFDKKQKKSFESMTQLKKLELIHKVTQCSQFKTEDSSRQSLSTQSRPNTIRPKIPYIDSLQIPVLKTKYRPQN